MDELQALLKELHQLNEHLRDFKTMLAPYLGYVVIERQEDLKEAADGHA